MCDMRPEPNGGSGEKKTLCMQSSLITSKNERREGKWNANNERREKRNDDSPDYSLRPKIKERKTIALFPS